MRVVWTGTARRDLAGIREYITADSPEAARRVSQRIRDAVRKLARYPHLGRPGRVPGTRELVIPGTPYLVPYTVHRDQLAILAVLHGAQEWPKKPTSSPSPP